MNKKRRKTKEINVKEKPSAGKKEETKILLFFLWFDKNVKWYYFLLIPLCYFIFFYFEWCLIDSPHGTVWCQKSNCINYACQIETIIPIKIRTTIGISFGNASCAHFYRFLLSTMHDLNSMTSWQDPGSTQGLESF